LECCKNRFLRDGGPRSDRAFERNRTPNTTRVRIRQYPQLETWKELLRTHEANRDVNSCAGGIGCPSVSVAGRNSYAESILAIPTHSTSRAKKRPGQIRRPYPNAASGSGSGVTGSKKRSGLNLDGSGYVMGSCIIALPGRRNNRVKNVGK
jgi:hypothetical protein